MAHVLDLVWGANTINLSSGDAILSSYQPQHPDDGADDVVESAVVHLSAASKTALQTAVRQIEEFFQRARRVGDDVYDRHYVRYQVDGESSGWRSEVLDGRIELGRYAMALWGNISLDLTVTWRRRAYWEGDEVELPIAYTGGETTGGVPWQAVNSGNSLSVDATGVSGDQPAPFRLELANAKGSDILLDEAHVFVDAWTDPTWWHTNAVMYLEGENADTGGPADDVTDTSCRGNQYRRFSWTGSTSGSLFGWTISNTWLAKTEGRSFRAFLRTANAYPSNGVYLRQRLSLNSGSLIAEETAEIQLENGSKLHDLGVVHLPPTGRLQDHYSLEYYHLIRAGASGEIQYDVVYFMPTDGYGRYEYNGGNIPNGDALVLNGIDGLYYERDASTSRPTFPVVAVGSPLLWPGRKSLLFLLYKDSTGDMPIVAGNEWTARLYYRPRRALV